MTEPPAWVSVGGGANLSRDPRRRAFLSRSDPSVLGLHGFAGATFLIAVNLAGWGGTAFSDALLLVPGIVVFGGLAQLPAVLLPRHYRGMAINVVHGLLCALFLGYGLIYLLTAVHVISDVDVPVVLRWWFGLLTLASSAAAVAIHRYGSFLALVLIVFASGGAVTTVGLAAGIPGWRTASACLYIGSAVLGWLRATAIMLMITSGRVP
ncbi:hypothetical protein [Rugosimonospora africana]|uniref:Uncharacterized protein n=1 Tax=Rugosimonospora africana TaxID=556532 RepID=A0A8J3R1U5_9ACTN|nr:hypothetical protein [Rugosimonospora africana]GIH20078.1 hypothetical protein Raf01_82500 [Rugosimonospora africana]